MRLRSNRAASESAGEAPNRSAVYRTTGMSDAGIAELNCLQAHAGSRKAVSTSGT